MTRRVIEAELGLSAEQSSKLARFQDLFLKWNASINLSAARTANELDEHLEDCLHVVPALREAKRVLDVGSGGGLPVVVVAICLPDVELVALEPVHKKHAFLRTAARELGLANLSAFAIRADDHETRDYDAATSRATFDLREWLELGLTFVRPGGRVIGFEAVERTDLPWTVERRRYEVRGKQRALVIVERGS